MQRARYIPLSDSARETYEFLSSGPKGTIKKVVQYILIGGGVYNLAFGDWDERTQSIRDDVRTNNEDRDKVLTTVAFTVFDFMKYHPSAIILAEGSTPARTRLYQMGISDNWAEIEQLFDVQGYYNEYWEPFRKGRNYKAFSLKTK
jgi:hypothetical protein